MSTTSWACQPAILFHRGTSPRGASNSLHDFSQLAVHVQYCWAENKQRVFSNIGIICVAQMMFANVASQSELPTIGNWVYTLYWSVRIMDIVLFEHSTLKMMGAHLKWCQFRCKPCLWKWLRPSWLMTWAGQQPHHAISVYIRVRRCESWLESWSWLEYVIHILCYYEFMSRKCLAPEIGVRSSVVEWCQEAVQSERGWRQTKTPPP